MIASTTQSPSQGIKHVKKKKMLKLEIAIPAAAPSMDFDFNNARPMPFLSAPSTPKRFGAAFSLSAPTSPSRLAEFHRHFHDDDDDDDDEEFINGGGGGGEERISGNIPFHWEQSPGTPKSPRAAASSVEKVYIEGDIDFAFDFSSELEKASLSADELFDGGKIRPLKPPPGVQLQDVDSTDQRSPLISPRSPRSPMAKGKRIISEVFSPRRKKLLDSDPFATAIQNTRKRAENERGRERISGLTTSSSRRAARSLSPFRVAQFPWEEEEEEKQQDQPTAKQSAVLNQNSSISSNSSSSSSSSSTSKSSSKKWRLRDFLLFRSASEGRASDKDPMRRKQEQIRNTSFRPSADGGDSGSVSGSRRKGRVSAHELHYKTNKAVSEDLKKKTFLPYKQGILGRFAFNPTVHALR